MDTQSLIKDSKARFNHNAAKSYLKEKYQSKLIVADQGGLWKATPELIGFLASSTDEFVVLLDQYDNPCFVNRINLHDALDTTYRNAMELWFAEWKELESKR